MITIKKVETKKDLKKFIEFPNILYKDNPYYVPSLYSDEYNHLNLKKNPAHAYCDTIYYLAYDENNQIVGRVAGIINLAYNKDHNQLQARFNRIDFIDSFEVCKTLLDAIEDWAKEKGMEEVIGPIGFTDLDKQGLLVEGFEEMDMFITLYHFPYYKEHIEACGYLKDVDWIEYELDLADINVEYQEKLHRLSEKIADRSGYHLKKIKNRFKIKKILYELFAVYNEAFAPLYGFQAVTKKVIDFYMNQVILIINLDYIWIVVDNDDKIAGFGLMMPSMSAVTKKHKGKMNLFNIFSYLKAIFGKNDVLDMYFIAIKPELQSLGVTSVIFAEGVNMAIKNKVKFAYTGPQLETNFKILNMWQPYNMRLHRRRRSFIKKLV